MGRRSRKRARKLARKARRRTFGKDYVSSGIRKGGDTSSKRNRPTRGRSSYVRRGGVFGRR